VADWHCKNGVSSWEIHRSIKVTQKTAWFMLHRSGLRCKADAKSKLSGEVEAMKPTSRQGAQHHMNKPEMIGTGGEGKILVMGLLEPTGEVNTKVRTRSLKYWKS